MVSCGPDTCVVARGGRILETYKKDQVVVRYVLHFVARLISDPLPRGLASTLAGRLLTPLQVLQVSNAFTRVVIPDTSERARTPPLDHEPQPDNTASPSPWIIDENEREELGGICPKLTGE